MSQNMDLEARRKDFQMVQIDQNLKNEFGNSHFHMGNYKSNFYTSFQTQYQQTNENQNISLNKFISPNKFSSYKVGNDKVYYETETQIKFLSPNLNKNKLQ
jgi:hypothetical protein